MLPKLGRYVPSHTTVVAYLALFLVLGGGAAYAAATIGSDDVIDESLRGVDVRNNSLGAADLGVRLRGARQPRLGPANNCGMDSAWDECVTVNFTNPRPQRLLLLGSADAVIQSSGGGGQCRFSIGGLENRGLRTFADDDAIVKSLSFNTVTGILDAGFYELSLNCREEGPSVAVSGAELSVATVGDG